MKSQKITKQPAKASTRRYDDACATAHALDLVGERWALLVIRELMFGPKRFSDLRADLPGISANVLTQRLEGLAAAGILMRRKLAPPNPAQVYELTEWGYQAEPIFQTLGRWAVHSPHHDPSLPFSATSLFLSFRTMLDSTRAAGIDARIGFRIGAESFIARLAEGRIEIARGEPRDVDLSLTGTASTIAAAIYGGQPLDRLEAVGSLSIGGDRALADRFVTLFPVPPRIDEGARSG